MEIRKIRVLRGPNIWSRHPVLEAWVDLGPLKDSPSNSIPGFNERYMAWLPSMIEHRCSIGERGGFFQRMRDGTYPAHILEHTCIELQTLAGTPVGFGKARETPEEGVYRVVVRYRDEQVARAALFAARELILAAMENRPFDVAAEVAKLRALADRVCLGPSTAAIVAAAEARGIPYRRLNDGSLVQLGQGCKQHRIWTAETDRTSALAESIAQDKELTKTLLRNAGIPVPAGRLVSSPEDAWEAATDVGLPVVVKPKDANHARGVFTGLETEAQVKTSYELALREGSAVIVEKFALGAEHRLLVVGDRMVAAARGDAAQIVGDGQRTVAQLIEEQLNSDPRRGDDESFPLSKIILDPPTVINLERQGYKPESVPVLGTAVVVQYSDNLNTDVTDLVHPTTASHVVQAAQIVGLDIAGLDVVVRDISIPLEEQGGVIVEVNAGPGLAMHLKPSIGTPRPVGEAIIDSLFAPGETGRIPVVCVTGTNGKTTVTRLISHILRSNGRLVGMTTSEGIDVGGHVIDRGDCAGPRSARKVLLNPKVEAGVFEVGRGGILREGLGFDRCDVAVVTNIAEPDHLGLSGVMSADDMFTVKRSPVDVVLPSGYAVLKANDALVAKMASLSAGGVIFFAPDPADPVLIQHRTEGKRAVFVRDGRLMLAESGHETALGNITEIPMTHGGRVPFQVENALAAAAACWGLGIPHDVIRAGLETFQGGLRDDPGRFNLLPYEDATVIVDDCHNVSALQALTVALDRFPATRRSVVYSAGDDRRDVDVIRQGEMLAQAFDRVFLYEDPSVTGRNPGELLALFRQGLSAGGRVNEIVQLPRHMDAVEGALKTLAAGEILVIQPCDGDVEATVARFRDVEPPPAVAKKAKKAN
jgi:cyanophycin synthetase